MKNLLGTVLITAGAKRIGQAIALRLSKLGYTIALHYNHSQKEAKATAQQIIKSGGQCTLFQCDLTNENETLSLINNIHAKYKNLNLLINNASIFEKSSLKTATLESFNKHFDIHLKTPFILTQNFAKVCKKGQIINILDTNVVQNKTEYFTYLLSKKSLYEFTKLAAVELAPSIRVNAIAPGFILAPRGGLTNNLKQRIAKIPLKQKGTIEQITESIEFLINNSFLTGQVIFCDGGEHLI